jgi:hypothetical protein
MKHGLHCVIKYSQKKNCIIKYDSNLFFLVLIWLGLDLDL